MEKLLLARVYAALLVVDGLFAIGLLLSLPGSEQAWLLGMSKSRFMLFAGFLASVLAGIGLALFSVLEPNRLQTWLQAVSRFLQSEMVFWLGTGAMLALFVGSTQLLHLSYQLPDDALSRWKPLLWWGSLFGLQTLFLFPLLRFGRIFPQIHTRTVWRDSILFLSIIVIVWGGIALTGLGIQPDIAGWDPPGVPILPWHILAAWAIAVPVLLLSKEHDRHSAKNRMVDGLLALGLWVAAFMAWTATPMAHTFFSPQMTPPNAEFYPYSDAGNHDLIAQSLLIGEGYDGIARKPLYAIFLAVLHALLGQDYDVIVNGQIAVLALLPVVLFALGNRMHNRTTGLLLSLLIIFREQAGIALSETIRVSHTKLLMSDVPAALLIAILVLVFMQWWQRTERTNLLMLLAGGVSAALLFVRPQAILMLPMLFAVPFLRFGWKRWRDWGSAALLGVIGLLLVLTPWLVRSWTLVGQPAIMPITQSGFVASQYSLQPSGTYVRPLPGETDEEYAVRMNDSIRQFVQEHPGQVVKFVTAHFLRNHVATAVILPTSFWLTANAQTDLFPLWRTQGEQVWQACCSARAFVHANPYWGGWDGSLPAGAALPLLVSLALVAIGLAVLWRRWHFGAFVPLLAFLLYVFSTAVGRYSGWRLIQPVDWVALLYFAVGLGFVSQYILRSFGWLRAPGTAIEQIPAPERFSLKFNRAVVFLLAGLLGFGLLMPLAGHLFPRHFEDKTQAQLWQSLSHDEQQTISTAMSAEALTRLSNHPDVVIYQGRAFYPRYYTAGEGMPGNAWFAYAVRDFERLGFSLVGPRGETQFFLALDSASITFPNAVDVTVIGCAAEGGVDALAVFFADESLEPLIRRPLSSWSCRPVLYP